MVEVVGTVDLNPANGRYWSVSLFFDPKDAGGDLKKKNSFKNFTEKETNVEEKK